MPATSGKLVHRPRRLLTSRGRAYRRNHRGNPARIPAAPGYFQITSPRSNSRLPIRSSCSCVLSVSHRFSDLSLLFLESCSLILSLPPSLSSSVIEDGKFSFRIFCTSRFSRLLQRIFLALSDAWDGHVISDNGKFRFTAIH